MLPDVASATLRSPDHAVEIITEPDLPTDTVCIPVKLCNLPPFHAIAVRPIGVST